MVRALRSTIAIPRLRNAARTIVLLSLFPLTVSSQNLIPNPGFESMAACPAQQNNAYYWGPDYLLYAPPWRRACWSADYLHDCGFSNYAGQQSPRTGLAKAGFMAWKADATDFREYLQVLLAEPLRAGVEYRFSMYVSLADDCQYHLSALGVKFYENYLGDVEACDELVGKMPDAVLCASQGPLDDKTGWRYVEGIYTARGGEDHLVVGHFAKDIHSKIYGPGAGTNNSIYYYIDDTALDSVGFTDIPMPNVFTPNGDGLNEVLSPPAMDSVSVYRMEVFNRWGALVHSETANPPSWNGRDGGGNAAQEGVYYYLLTVIDNKGKTFQKKGFVQLLGK